MTDAVKTLFVAQYLSSAVAINIDLRREGNRSSHHSCIALTSRVLPVEHDELTLGRQRIAFTIKSTAPPPTSQNREESLAVQAPIDLQAWIEENSHLFRPPVSNRYLYDGRDFFVMIIKGPNARNDFHQVNSEEFFYQLKGDIKVRVREGEHIIDHLVREGETFFIPPNVPHAPVRPPHTLGLVVERRRPAGEHEHVIFYCPRCEALVEDIDFDCADIVNHFSRAMLDFWNDDARRTCPKCGARVERPEPVEPFGRDR